MPSSSSQNTGSFIPKRSPVKQQRKSASRHIYVFTLISYVLLFATLIAVGGVFLYKNLVDNQVNQALTALDNEIKSFEVSDMEMLQSFENRLLQARSRVDNSVSHLSILRSLEEATIDLVQFDSFEMERLGDDRYDITASIITDSFDSTMFQRGVFQRNQTIENVVVSDLQTDKIETDETLRPFNESVESFSLVSFKAQLEIPIDRVPYQPSVLEPVVEDNDALFELSDTTNLVDEPTIDEDDGTNESDL